jgi:hypothetical protein
MGVKGGAGEWRALVTACERGDENTIRQYLGDEDLNVDVDFQHCEVGKTPLLAAVEHGRSVIS